MRVSGYTKAFVTGLEGPSSSRFKRGIATCKHFAAYDLENYQNVTRFNFDVKDTTQGLSTLRSIARHRFMPVPKTQRLVPSCAALILSMAFPRVSILISFRPFCVNTGVGMLPIIKSPPTALHWTLRSICTTTQHSPNKPLPTL